MQPNPARTSYSPATVGLKTVNNTAETLSITAKQKKKEIGDVKTWPLIIFINIRRKEIEVNNGEGKPSLRKTAGFAYWQQRLVSNPHAISTHNKSLINPLIKAFQKETVTWRNELCLPNTMMRQSPLISPSLSPPPPTGHLPVSASLGGWYRPPPGRMCLCQDLPH